MNLEKLARRNGGLLTLLQQSQQWQKLDRQIKQVLPANLRAHFQTACIEEGTLVLLANNNMAASRLRMITPGLLPKLQNLHPDIANVRIKTIPARPLPPRENHLKLSEAAIQSFRHSAKQLQHHPKLAEALRELAEKHGNNN
ncbi:DUF721 domain-containing protein [Neisseria montereyensis]|uniref:DUF721 domain-containing protein n=1 Tax=Neisseria montereyensis TaxID=2973938 RepID=A0ABT2FB41_9NEIS|nr:DUF721 domain-containing protein [Neisseria montereyensis]MCS4533377.1 DUF721 domain-containing protein [Neisseria montereyensis]